MVLEIGACPSSPAPYDPQPVGSIAVSHLAWQLPGGDELFHDVGFRVGNGDRVALVGANGVGKSSLLKLITGDLEPGDGTISVDGQWRRKKYSTRIDSSRPTSPASANSISEPVTASP